MYNFVIGNIYNFNTRAPAVLGAAYKNATVLGVIDYTTACTFINVELMQRTIYPMLPQGTPDNPKRYSYLLIQTEAGIKTVVAYPWIDDVSIQEVTSITLTIRIPNVNMADAESIRDSLTLMGYSGFTIETD